MEPPNPWFSFVSTLIWQLLVIALVIGFRRQIAELLVRIASVKFGGTEIGFQEREAKAEASSAKAEKELDLATREDFLAPSDIRRLIESSEHFGDGEKVLSPYLLFSTDAQRTWLVPTNRNLFCVLDDAGTRVNGRMVQWHMGLDEARPITTRQYNADWGLVNIGKRRNWLYSRFLHPNRDRLHEEIRTMVEAAKSDAK